MSLLAGQDLATTMSYISKKVHYRNGLPTPPFVLVKIFYDGEEVLSVDRMADTDQNNKFCIDVVSMAISKVRYAQLSENQFLMHMKVKTNGSWKTFDPIVYILDYCGTSGVLDVDHNTEEVQLHLNKVEVNPFYIVDTMCDSGEQELSDWYQSCDGWTDIKLAKMPTPTSNIRVFEIDMGIRVNPSKPFQLRQLTNLLLTAGTLKDVSSFELTKTGIKVRTADINSIKKRLTVCVFVQ